MCWGFCISGLEQRSSIERQVKHPIYGTLYRKKASSVQLSCTHTMKTTQLLTGDVVTIRECAPISKKKSWTLVDVIERPKKA
ncbi:30S ribosomal protein S17 [Pseudoalteromonas piscicida]|uniref:30S ribosomal protein S17 n=1 Tax=Pseudoalteromonas piscicida TaxID=43662 RepID=UPI000E35B08D|nr:30S ribosomal protein S17 [Pseudoalteromonas piscicida]AXQ96538.1 30S ribosomal protein S17 [Pseudoalteromonas piscicida]